MPFGKTGRSDRNTWTALNPVERVILLIGSIVCAGIIVYTGKLLGIPTEPGFSGSLLASGAPVSGIIVVVVALGICWLVAAAVTALVEVESGLFCCCVGLSALSIRCGGMRPVLQFASGNSVFLVMILELLLLAGMIGGCWYALLRAFGQLGTHPADAFAAPNEITDATLTQKLITLGVQVVVMGICEMILIQSDAKAQAMAGVCISAFLGTLAAYMFTALPVSIWYWSGPVALGAIGYLLALINGGTGAIGDVRGWSAPLARATPLDYASVGIAGALLGYWCSRRWAQPEESDTSPVPAQ